MLNVIYSLLVEHGSGEQIEEINKTLDAELDGGDPDELATILARAIPDAE